MRNKDFFLNSIWFGIVPRLPSILNILLLPLITPYLSQSDYGFWGLITAFSSVFLSLGMLGLDIHLSNSFYEYPQKFYYVWGRIFFYITISSFLLAIVNSVVVFSLLEKSNYRFAVSIVSSFPILSNVFILFANQLYIFKAKPKVFVTRVLISNLIGIIILYITSVKFKLGYISFILSYGSIALFNSILLGYQLFSVEKLIIVPDFRIRPILLMLKQSIFVIIHGLGFILLTSLPRIIMDWREVNINNIGLVMSGFSIGEYVNVILLGFATAVVPKIQKYYREKNFIGLKNVFIFIQVSGVLVVALYATWLHDVFIFLVRNRDLYSAKYFAQFSLFNNTFLPFYVLLSSIVFIQKKTKKLLWLVFFPGLINAILAWFLIPLFSFKIISLTSFISGWTLLIIPLFVKYYNEMINEIFGSFIFIIKMGIIVFAIFALTLLIKDFSLVIRLFWSFILIISYSYLLYFKKIIL